jgi:hypothetical protein
MRGRPVPKKQKPTVENDSYSLSKTTVGATQKPSNSAASLLSKTTVKPTVANDSAFYIYGICLAEEQAEVRS